MDLKQISEKRGLKDDIRLFQTGFEKPKAEKNKNHTYSSGNIYCYNNYLCIAELIFGIK